MILIGIVIGYVIGLNVGLFLGKRVMERLHNTIIESYKRDEKFWFEEYLQMTKWYQEMQVKYVKEALKNVAK